MSLFVFDIVLSVRKKKRANDCKTSNKVFGFDTLTYERTYYIHQTLFSQNK